MGIISAELLYLLIDVFRIRNHSVYEFSYNLQLALFRSEGNRSTPWNSLNTVLFPQYRKLTSMYTYFLVILGAEARAISGFISFAGHAIDLYPLYHNSIQRRFCLEMTLCIINHHLFAMY